MNEMLAIALIIILGISYWRMYQHQQRTGRWFRDFAVWSGYNYIVLHMCSYVLLKWLSSTGDAFREGFVYFFVFAMPFFIIQILATIRNILNIINLNRIFKKNPNNSPVKIFFKLYACFIIIWIVFALIYHGGFLFPVNAIRAMGYSVPAILSLILSGLIAIANYVIHQYWKHPQQDTFQLQTIRKQVFRIAKLILYGLCALYIWNVLESRLVKEMSQSIQNHYEQLGYERIQVYVNQKYNSDINHQMVNFELRQGETSIDILAKLSNKKSAGNWQINKATFIGSKGDLQPLFQSALKYNQPKYYLDKVAFSLSSDLPKIQLKDRQYAGIKRVGSYLSKNMNKTHTVLPTNKKKLEQHSEAISLSYYKDIDIDDLVENQDLIPVLFYHVDENWTSEQSSQLISHLSKVDDTSLTDGIYVLNLKYFTDKPYEEQDIGKIRFHVTDRHIQNVQQVEEKFSPIQDPIKLYEEGDEDYQHYLQEWPHESSTNKRK